MNDNWAEVRVQLDQALAAQRALANARRQRAGEDRQFHPFVNVLLRLYRWCVSAWQ